MTAFVVSELNVKKNTLITVPNLCQKNFRFEAEAICHQGLKKTFFQVSEAPNLALKC